MATAVTEDIHVTTRVRFDPGNSDVRLLRFVYAYHITIVNRSKETVQLLRRKWRIADGLAPVRIVEGPGVVGEIPVLAPGESYSYVSGCDLRGSIGAMEGHYLMLAKDTGRHFEVVIPTMTLVHPPVLN